LIDLKPENFVTTMAQETSNKISDLLERAAEAGVFLSYRDKGLHFKLAVNAFPEDLKNEIVANKAEVISFLKERQLAEKSTIPRCLNHSGRSESQVHMLSFAQRRLWFIDQMGGGSVQYNMPGAMRIVGKFEEEVAERAFRRIIERHQPLRTVIVNGEQGPVQRIRKEFEFRLGWKDLRDKGREEQELLVAEALEADAVQAFDLSRDLMLRAAFLRLSEEEGVLQFNMHHIAADGWSMGILVKEFGELYEAYAGGKQDPLPELSIQYADYAEWQREWLQGEVVERQLRYWEEQLADLPEVHGLVLDRVRPGVQSYEGGVETVEVEEELLRGLKQVGRGEQATLFMVLQGVFGLLLWRHGNGGDVVMGTAVANRLQKELEPLVGFFVNTLVLRVECKAGEKYREYVERVRAVNLEAQGHQDVPFEQVVERLKPRRSSSYGALFQIMFNMELNEENTSRLMRRDRAAAFCDLMLDALEDRGRLELRFTYNTALFEAATIARMGGRLKNLLRGVVANPEARIEELPLLSEAEREHLLYELNRTGVEYPRNLCVHELFETQVAKAPEALAVVYGKRQLTYAQLNRQANQLAHYLHKLGIKPDSRVAICMDRGIEMLVALLGVLKAGAAYVPLDPAHPQRRLQRMFQDSSPEVVLTQKHLQAAISEWGHALPLLDLSSAAPPWKDQPENNPDRASLGPTPQHVACIIYTSGSSGVPKGAMIEHRSIVNLVRDLRSVQLSPEDVVGQVSNTSFDAATFEIWGALAAGAQIAGIAQKETISPLVLAEKIKETRTSVLLLTTALFNQIASDAPNSLAGLRCLLFGGEVAEPRRVARVLSVAKPEHLLHLYGPTETTTYSTRYEVKSINDDRKVPIGQPVSNTLIYVLDARGDPAPLGVPGDMYIGGAGLARGYLNRPELTAERFVPNPFAQQAGARMYRTGDLGRWLADGNIEFLGRSDAQVKIRGFRIELGEIEARLLECAGVRQAVVMVREDTPEEKRLVAYYVMDEESAGAGAQPEMGAMRRHLSGCLPEYMVPAAYVRLQRLPLTPHGKLDRNALPQPQSSAYAVREYEEPQGEMESRVAGIWAEVLSIERVGRHDNFFELGGHSLLAMRLVERLRQQKFHLDVHTIFTNPILSGMAARVMENVDGRQDLERNNKFQHSSLVELKVGNPSVQPFFLIHPVGGYVSCYSELALGLEYEGPVFGLQIAGTVSPTIEQMAGKYLEAVRSVQPQGPYLLGGWSMGGVVAYEMARQLNCVGECISVLVMLDSSFPNRMKTDVNWSLDEKLALGIIASELGIRHQGLAPVENNTWNKITLEELLIVVLQAGKAQDRLPASFGIQELRQRHEIILKNASGVRSYQALPYDGEIHLVRAMENTNADPFLGWSALPAKVSVINQPGDHFSMMRRPHVAALSKKVDSLLRAHFTQSLTLRKTMRIEVTDVIPKPR
jgi:amino acid adenylation domain-containing protein